MRKKIIYTLALIICLLAGLTFYANSQTDNSTCAFCNPQILSSQMIYEGNLTYAIYTHKPITPGHCLILPKRHVERFEELTDAESLEICQVIRKINQAVSFSYQTSGYLLAEKNGKEAGQTVPHVHFHYIPCKKEETSLGLLFKALIANLKQPISQKQMLENREKIQKALE